MTADGDTKDDVRVPEGDLGDRIRKLWDEEKELRKYSPETPSQLSSTREASDD
jgi:hypothetical protein